MDSKQNDLTEMLHTEAREANSRQNAKHRGANELTRMSKRQTTPSEHARRRGAQKTGEE